MALRVSCPKGVGWTFWAKEKLQGISIRGWTLEDTTSIEKITEKYFELQDSLEDNFEKYKMTVAAEKATLIQKHTDTNAQVHQLTEKRSAAEAALETLETQIEEKNDELKDLNEEVATAKAAALTETTAVEKLEKAEQLCITNLDIANKKNELSVLQKDVSLYADTIKGLAQQGTDQINKQMNNVLWPCLGILVALVGLSFYATWDFSEEFNSHPDRLEGLLTIRFFVLALVASGFYGIYKFSVPFVVNIIQIQQRRLRISEITMLAREFSESIPGSEEISEEDILDINVKMRTTLIREYLAGKFDPEVIKNNKVSMPTLIVGAMATKILGFNPAAEITKSLIQTNNEVNKDRAALQ